MLVCVLCCMCHEYVIVSTWEDILSRLYLHHVLQWNYWDWSCRPPIVLVKESSEAGWLLLNSQLAHFVIVSDAKREREREREIKSTEKIHQDLLNTSQAHLPLSHWAHSRGAGHYCCVFTGSYFWKSWLWACSINCGVFVLVYSSSLTHCFSLTRSTSLTQFQPDLFWASRFLALLSLW